MDANTAQATTSILKLGAVTTDHPLIAIPYTVEIDGRQYKGEGLSLVRAEVVGLLDRALKDATRVVRFAFIFQGFTVVLSISCEISKIGGETGTIALRFVEPAGDHLPQLRHLLNSYVAGDLVTMGQFLAVHSVPGGAARPKLAAGSSAGAGALVRRILGMGALAALTFGLFAAVVTLGYQRLFVTQVLTPARILPEGQTLAALAAGQLDYLNPSAAKGEVAFAIRSVTGQMLSIAMPCDCTAVLSGPKTGDTLNAGEPVMLVHAPEAPLMIHGSVPGADLFKLGASDRVEVTLADGTSFDAHPADLTALRGAMGAEDEVAILLRPEMPIPASQLGALVSLSIVKPLPAYLNSLTGLARLGQD